MAKPKGKKESFDKSAEPVNYRSINYSGAVHDEREYKSSPHIYAVKRC